MPPKKTAAKKAAKKVATKQAKVAAPAAKRTAYLAIHEAYMAERKLKVGDNVIVQGGWEKNQLGFNGKSSDYSSHSHGSSAVITKIENDGITVKSGNSTSKVPIFSIEKTGPKIRLGSSGYYAAIQPDGSIQVGCTHVDIATLTSIVAASEKVRKEGI